MQTALLLSLLIAPLALGQGTPPKPGAGQPTQATVKDPGAAAAAIRERMESTLKVLADNQKYDKAIAAMDQVFEQAIVYAPADLGLLTEVAATRRMVSQLDKVESQSCAETLAFLRANPAVARTLAMLVQVSEKPGPVYEVLERLRAAHGDVIAKYPGLTAALCVVHDEPIPLMYAEGKPSRVADPVALFRYFTGNERRLAFGLNDVPAELLVFMVGPRADIDELEWALSKHAGDRNVGKRYSDLTYDTAAYKYNKPKKISELPYTLQNLRRVGGVCQEQAYYAANVAKAIGVPSAEVSGQHADVGHVWVGFLQKRGGGYGFNCDEGHYDEYEEVRGSARDPQNGGTMSQSQLELLALLMETPIEKRHAAVASLDAAQRLRRVQVSNRVYPPPAPVKGAEPVIKTNDAKAQLAFIKAASELCPANPAVWTSLLEWGPGLSTEERQAWFDAVHDACRTKEPDFAFQITTGLIRGVKEMGAQLAAWDWLAKRYNRRPDLAGTAKMLMAQCYLDNGNKEKGYEGYRDVARKHINDGPFALLAVERAADLLREMNKPGLVAELYGDVFRGASRPDNVSPGFFRASNYYKIGARYAQALEDAQRIRDAEQVRRQLRAGEDKN